MEFRTAAEHELNQIRELYSAARQEPFCVWDDEYPGMGEIMQDHRCGTLFVLAESGSLAGVISIVPENELDDQPCWQSRTGKERELARITVAAPYRGRGLAGVMVTHILNMLKAQGCPAVHLSAAKSNLPAVNTYRRLGFRCAGEAELFGGHYCLFEMIF